MSSKAVQRLNDELATFQLGLEALDLAVREDGVERRLEHILLVPGHPVEQGASDELLAGDARSVPVRGPDDARLVHGENEIGGVAQDGPDPRLVHPEPLLGRVLSFPVTSRGHAGC